MKTISVTFIALILSLMLRAQFPPQTELFRFDSTSTPVWSSPENINGQKGSGAKENGGAKGRPYLSIPAGDSLVLIDIHQPGIINRIWVTVSDRSPEMLRSLILDIYWDQEVKPAVSVSLADFFGMALGRMSTFHNIFFSSPEGRSFNCIIPMPFKKGARMVLRNESSRRLNNIFFDVDAELKSWNADNLYFHAYWHRDTATKLARDFELLPAIQGHGRLLGVNVGVNTNLSFGNTWWGEGEVKIYLDGDKEFPSLVGTGTEDYIGDAWGQSAFFTDYTGCLIADEKKGQWTFYRYHVTDAIFFKKDLRMTIHQMGSATLPEIQAIEKKGALLIPTALDDGSGSAVNVYGKRKTFLDAYITEKYALFYRSDDVSSTAYFYLDQPVSNLPEIQTKEIRLYRLKSGNK